MTLGFDSAILLISSYANPVDTLQHARNHGYQVTDFMVTPMPFGYYSSEPKVFKPPMIFGCLVRCQLGMCAGCYRACQDPAQACSLLLYAAVLLQGCSFRHVDRDLFLYGMSVAQWIGICSGRRSPWHA